MPEDLPDWWTRVQALPSPLRRAMHALGLLSGLRPARSSRFAANGCDLEDHAIPIPTMKSGEPFDLPLSDRMIATVRAPSRSAMRCSRARSGSSPPAQTRVVEATPTWREVTLPNETGHILRHTYRTIAQRAGIDKIDARLLLDHTVPGIDGVYIHEKALFDRLVSSQEIMTSSILELLDGK